MVIFNYLTFMPLKVSVVNANLYTHVYTDCLSYIISYRKKSLYFLSWMNLFFLIRKPDKRLLQLRLQSYDKF